MNDIIDELEKRDFIAQLSSPELRQGLRRGAMTMYVGFDPSADSLHLGHLVPIMAMAHFQRFGHRVLVIVGGATGMVGDPSGKSSERKLLTPPEVAKNSESVKQQLSRFLEFSGANAASLLDNHQWIGPISFIDWLREVGKFFSVNTMIAKDSVKSRLASEQGLSFTEFAYMTMQAYDFLHLFDKYDCRIQGGGNDQWGNITAGIDLIRKTRGTEAFGITFPLLSTSSGEKFGKSAGNAVWLDAVRTSPFQFYQYWLRTDDRDVEKFLKLFTFLPLEKISQVCEEHRETPEERKGQQALATEVTCMVHGIENLQKVQRASGILFGAEIEGLSDSELADIFADVPSTRIERKQIDDGVPFIELLVATKLCSSKADARRLVANGGAYLNNRRVNDPNKHLASGDLASESFMVLRTGKKNYHLVHFSKA